MLRRKYLSLGLGELGAAAVFLALAVGSVMPRLDREGDAVAMWCALIPLLVVLIQAGAYWLLARTWVARTPMPRSIAMLYRAFRVIDVGVVLLGLVGVVVFLPEALGLALAVLAVWVFGAIEYMNYFVARLSYPLWRWPALVGQWRTPRLIRDLESSPR